MVWKKSFIAQRAFLPVLFLILCVLPQAELPFLRSYFACCGELYPLFRVAFSLFLFFAGWGLASVEKWIPGKDKFFSALFLCCGVLLLPGMFLLHFPVESAYMFLGIWGGYILGSLEKTAEGLKTPSFFRILPLPFLLYLLPVQIRTEYHIYIVLVTGGILFFLHTLLVSGGPERKKQFLLFWGCITLFLLSGIYGMYGIRQRVPQTTPAALPHPAKPETTSSSLFPIFTLALLHTDQMQQNVLVLSEEPFRVTEYLPEAADCSPALLRRNVSLSRLPEFFQEEPHPFYNIILLPLQKPHNIQSARLYSLPFYQNLKQRLQKGGVLAIRLPEEKTENGINEYLFRLLRSVFTGVKKLPGGKYILCSTDKKPLLTDPDLLEFRAGKLFSGKFSFPPGFFHILLDEAQTIPEGETEKKASSIQYSSFSAVPLCITENATGAAAQFWKKLLHNRKIRKYIPLYALLFLTGYILFRYFCATGKRQGDFLVFENGIYTGTLIALCCAILPVKWGYEIPFFYDAKILLFPVTGFYCGSLLRKICKRKFMVYGCFILSGFPLFLFRSCFADLFLNGILLFAGGTVCAYFAESLHSFRKAFFPGAGSGLALACFSLILPELDIILPWILLLCFVPAVPASENMENGFEKSQKNATVQEG